MVTKADAVENWRCCTAFFEELEAQNNPEEVAYYITTRIVTTMKITCNLKLILYLKFFLKYF